MLRNHPLSSKGQNVPHIPPAGLALRPGSSGQGTAWLEREI